MNNTCYSNGTREKAAGAETQVSCACPALDVVESKDAYEVVVEVPGASKEDVELGVEKDVLSIRARVQSTPNGSGRYHVREHYPMELRREIRLGETIHAEGITAEVSRGLLTLHLPKVAAATPRRIEVR